MHHPPCHHVHQKNKESEPGKQWYPKGSVQRMMMKIMLQKRLLMDTKTSQLVVVWSQLWDVPLDGLHLFCQVSLLLPQDDPREGTVRAP